VNESACAVESLFDPWRKPSRFLFLDTHPEKLLGGNVPKTDNQIPK
jgi:hypothetical protein